MDFVPGAIGRQLRQHRRPHVQGTAADVGAYEHERPQHLVRRVAAVAGRRPDSRRADRCRGPGGRAVPPERGSARRPVPRLPGRFQPGRVVLPGHSPSELADRRDRGSPVHALCASNIDKSGARRRSGRRLEATCVLREEASGAGRGVPAGRVRGGRATVRASGRSVTRQRPARRAPSP